MKELVEITRGTTPILVFPIEETSIVKDVEITFSQTGAGKTHSFQKEYGKGEVELQKDSIRLRLSEEETFSFQVGFALVQMRILSKDNNVAGSLIEKIRILPSLSEDILSKETNR